jgi:hypothetical protein
MPRLLANFRLSTNGDTLRPLSHNTLCHLNGAANRGGRALLEKIVRDMLDVRGQLHTLDMP